MALAREIRIRLGKARVKKREGTLALGVLGCS